MIKIEENWKNVTARAAAAAKRSGRNPEDILVLAVSKMHPLDYVMAGMDCGIQDFGENYAQEMKEKQQEVVEKNLRRPSWHFIGHLQTNKVKYIIEYVKMIHSVDSVHLAGEISTLAARNNRSVDILLQVNTSGEESKSGCKPEEISDLARGTLALPNIKVRGLMTIGSYSENKEVSVKEFTLLRDLRDKVQREFQENDFSVLSMGMSHDYETAIELGATIVRVGTGIFGERDYSNKK